MSTRIEIIAIGNELTSGRILNTTSGSVARLLYEAGYTIQAMNTIGDHPKRIGLALEQAIARADTIIVTGGLGCTDDDLTTEAVAQAFQLQKVCHQEILDAIARQQRNNTIPSKLKKLAWLPEGATAFDPVRQISGYRLLHNRRLLFFLPGVPQQADTVLRKEVLPTLKRWHWGKPLATCQRLYRIFGLKESKVNNIIANLSFHPSVEIGYYPIFAEVHLNLVVRCNDKTKTKEIFTTSCTQIEHALGDTIFACDKKDMPAAVGELLLHNKKTLATAESCTGGLISEQITNSPGSSGYFLGGIVSYSNKMKVTLLNVKKKTLTQVGAVSKEVAQQMAISIRAQSGADFGIAVTGIAGPSGGSAEKPVGTVYIALDCEQGCIVQHSIFSGNREQIRQQTALSALNLVRKSIIKKENLTL